VAPNAFKAIEKGKVAAAEADYKAIKAAALNYYTDTGKWPENGANDTGFVTAPSPTPSGWNGPYLERWKSNNPWGGTYTYKKDSDTTYWSGTTEKRYLELTNVPLTAYTVISNDLGSDVVKQNLSTTTTIAILISKE
ncbi:MAG: type II secretion system protein GspG, partial [Desulfotomaculales bacterium]